MPKKLNALEIDILQAIAKHYPVSIKQVKFIYYIRKSYDMTIKSIEYAIIASKPLSYYAERGGNDID